MRKIRSAVRFLMMSAAVLIGSQTAEAFTYTTSMGYTYGNFEYTFAPKSLTVVEGLTGKVSVSTDTPDPENNIHRTINFTISGVQEEIAVSPGSYDYDSKNSSNTDFEIEVTGVSAGKHYVKISGSGSQQSEGTTSSGIEITGKSIFGPFFRGYAEYEVNVVAPTISLSKTQDTIAVGDDSTLTYHTNGDVKYSAVTSSDPSVLTVSLVGNTVKYHALKMGTAEVRLTNKSGVKICKVTVEPLTVRFKETSVSLNISDAYSLSAITSSNDKTFTWESTNDRIVVVDSKGKITGIRAGTAAIIVKNHGKSAACSVTVKDGSTDNAGTQTTGASSTSSGASVTTIVVVKKTQRQLAVEAYRKFLKKRTIYVLPKGKKVRKSNGKTGKYQGSKASSVKFSMIYLDNDNIPELVVYDETWGSGVFTFASGKVKRISYTNGAAGAYSAYYRKKGLFVEKRMKTEIAFSYVLRLKSGTKAKVMASLSYAYPGSAPVFRNSKGKMITGQDYGKLVKKYAGKVKPKTIQYSKNTAAKQKSKLK